MASDTVITDDAPDGKNRLRPTALGGIPFRDRLLTPEQAAEWLGITVSVLMKKHRSGIIPGFILGYSKYGNQVRFSPRAIQAHLAHRSRIPKEVLQMLTTEHTLSPQEIINIVQREIALHKTQTKTQAP